MQQRSLNFIRELATLLARYNLDYSQLASGKVILDGDEILLNTFRWGEHGYTSKILTDFTELFSQNIVNPQPIYLYSGDGDKHRCPYCGSSLMKNMFGFRKQRCINPNCINFHKQGFQVIQKEQK